MTRSEAHLRKCPGVRAVKSEGFCESDGIGLEFRTVSKRGSNVVNSS